MRVAATRRAASSPRRLPGRVMQGAKFLTFGGGGVAGMFSALEWILKGVVWHRSALCVCRVPDGEEGLRAGECWFVAVK